MVKPYITASAFADLEEIKAYTLAQWGTIQAKKYLAELQRIINILAENPQLGRVRPDVEKGVFSFPHKSHVIYYLAEKERIIVFGILGTAMLPKPHLELRLPTDVLE